jgi:hypothetical protein
LWIGHQGHPLLAGRQLSRGPGFSGGSGLTGWAEVGRLARRGQIPALPTLTTFGWPTPLRSAPAISGAAPR